MIQRGNGLGFPLETLAELGIGEFDRDVAIQTRVAGAIHLSHSARTKERKDFVRAEFISGRKRHMGNRAQCSPSWSTQEGWRTALTPIVDHVGIGPVESLCMRTLHGDALHGHSISAVAHVPIGILACQVDPGLDRRAPRRRKPLASM